MRTPAEVEKLKRDWKANPDWDIVEAEGFEEHREELQEYFNKCAKEWEKDWAKKLGIKDAQ